MADDLETLIARVGLSDRAAFTSLYDAVSGKLFGVALRVLKDRAAAEDAVQDSFVKIWQRADRYQVTGQSPMTWLITIARNTAIDRLRATRPVADIITVTETLEAVGATPEQAAVAGGEARRIGDCMAELEGDRRAAVRGAYLEGQSYQDLALRFGVPLNTMRTWLRRSMIVLKECLDR